MEPYGSVGTSGFVSLPYLCSQVTLSKIKLYKLESLKLSALFLFEMSLDVRLSYSLLCIAFFVTKMLMVGVVSYLFLVLPGVHDDEGGRLPIYNHSFLIGVL